MGMTRLYERWDELDTLFEQAMALPAAEVDAFCRSVCGADSELYELLSDLIASADSSDETVMESIAKLARDVAEDSSLSGTRIGPYKLEDRIGRGGMGDVYLASRADGAFEKKVAIKVLRSRHTGALSQQFRQERQVLADLSHPSIPALIDAGQLDDGRMYFIGEFVDGVSITEYCDERVRSVEAKLELLEKVGGALRHAHNNLVLHLDIKPDNVLVEKDGTPRLLDFGIARLFGEQDGGLSAFTPGYASPEQIRGERLTPSSDVYSFGALAFRVLTGARLFDLPRFASSATALAEREQAEVGFVDLAPLASLDGDLRAILKKALHGDPVDRYQTIESLLRDLESMRMHRPVSALPKTFRYRLSKYVRRHRLPIALVTLIVTALAGFLSREADLRQQAQAASAVAAREAQASQQIAEFMVDLFEVSDPGEARGNSVTARELLDRGAAHIVAELDDQPLVQSHLMRVMGDVYTQLGLHDQAGPMLENALSIRELALNSDDAELGVLLRHLGVLYLRESRLNDAERVLARSLTLAERQFGSYHATVGDSLNLIGVLQTMRSDYDSAQATLERALAIQEEQYGPDDEALSEIISNLASAHYRAGRLQTSIVLLERAVAITRTHRGDDHPALAIALDNLGNVYQTAGDNHTAVELQEEALRIREKALSPTHMLVANNIDNLSNAYFALGDFERTEALKLRALDIRQKTLGPSHRHVATSFGNLGNLYMDWGRFDEAEDYLQRSLTLRTELYEADNPRIAVGRLNLGALYLKKEAVDAAEAETLAAIDILEAKLTKDHLYWLYADWQLANIRSRQGRIAEARQLFERIHPLWQARPADDRDRTQMLEDYAAFTAAHGAVSEP